MSMSKRKVLIGVIGLGSLATWGCATTSGSKGVAQSRSKDERVALRTRAQALWDAKVAEDWRAVFDLQDPHSRAAWNEDDFVAWSQKNDPFKIQSFQFGDVQADGNMGWIEVKYNTLIRRFESLPPRDASLWQKWRRVDGTWYPVPLRELVSYPEPPSRRDAVEEGRLRARFMEAWRVRKAGDYHALYQFCDPYDHPKMPEQAYVDMQELLKYLSCDVKWVEVVGKLGRVQVVYRRKVTDPSMTKLPVETIVQTEDWIKVDGEWYQDLSRASGPTPGETHDAS